MEDKLEKDFQNINQYILGTNDKIYEEHYKTMLHEYENAHNIRRKIKFKKLKS